MKTRGGGLLNDWRRGRFYRYPRCCIAWFVTGWKLIGVLGLTGMYWRWLAEEWASHERDYVRCPICLAMDR